MKLTRFFSAVLSAALLTGLCACRQSNPVLVNPSAAVSASTQPSSPPEDPGVSENLPDSSETPAPTTPVYAPYNKDHRLDTDIPDLISGLEMPIAGATGFTSVELPVYSSFPGASTATPAPTPSTPPPAPPTTPPPTPEPPPSEPTVIPESPDPGPVEPVDPGPAESVDPGPGPAESADPGPSPVEPVDPTPPAQATEDPVPPPAQLPEPDPAETPDPAAAPLSAAARALVPLSAKAASYRGAAAVWAPGTGFVILEERGSWWRVTRGNVTGWIEHRYCMINLPDVIPSIIYDDTNAYSSLFASSGKSIPNVTGEAFHHTLVYNIRLDRQEFLLPILYSAARNICAAQHKALAEGNCLVVYQTYLPYETQMKVAENLTSLVNVDPEAKAGVSTSPWSINRFAVTELSNYQRGCALDVSMVKVNKAETKYIGSCPYLYTADYEDYQMPTAMHELSIAAVSTVSPNSSTLSDTMTEPAIALRGYFTSSGLSPQASAWWCFSDSSAMWAASARPSDGTYEITECFSRAPDRIGGAAV